MLIMQLLVTIAGAAGIIGVFTGHTWLLYVCAGICALDTIYTLIKRQLKSLLTMAIAIMFSIMLFASSRGLLVSVCMGICFESAVISIVSLPLYLKKLKSYMRRKGIRRKKHMKTRAAARIIPTGNGADVKVQMKLEIPAECVSESPAKKHIQEGPAPMQDSEACGAPKQEPKAQDEEPRYCRKCGTKAMQGQSHCDNCGAFVRVVFPNLKRNTVLLIIAAAATIFLFVAALSMQSEINLLKANTFALQDENSDLRDSLSFYESYIVVVVSADAECYHKASCHFVKNARQFNFYTKSSAVSSGYRACKVCH